MALDGAGDVFVVANSPQVFEQPIAGGPAITLVSDELDQPDSIAVDNAGNVLIGDVGTGQVIALPIAGGSMTTLPFSGLTRPTSLAVDGLGDVFVLDGTRIVELPFGCLVSSCQTVLIDTLIRPQAIAADNAGDVFYVDVTSAGQQLVKLPAGGGSPVTLYSSSSFGAQLALDGVGNIFVANFTTNTLGQEICTILQLPVAGGSPVPVSTVNPSIRGIAADSAGNVYFTAYSGQVAELQRSQSAPLNFGSVVSGGTTTLPLAITNSGSAPLLTTPSFSSPAYQIGTMAPEGCLASIPPGNTCTLQIIFSPAELGTYNSLLTLQTNEAANSLVTLQGNAVPVATPVLSLASGVFANAQTVTITDATAGATIYYTTNGASPTDSATPYTGPVSVTSTERLTAIAILDNVSSIIATAAYTIAPAPAASTINLSQGFSPSQMTFNGSATLDGPRLRLTSGLSYQAGSAFFAAPINVQSFTTYFTFRLSTPNADGFTFTIQNVGAAALGGTGASLGYAPLGKSVAVKFDLHNNAGEGSNSTGIYLSGALPTLPALSLAGSGINLNGGDTILAQISYNGTNLSLTLTDTVSLAIWTHSFLVNIPAAVGGNTAYVGFTGSTGVNTATQEILSWTYVAGPPGQPVPPPAAPPVASPLPLYSMGFGAVGMTVNGNASILGTALQLTSKGQNQAGSAFYNIPIRVDQPFTTDFTFQLSSNFADGFTFTLLSAKPNLTPGPASLGAYGGGLGYEGIPHKAGSSDFSLAIKFDLHDNAGEGPNSTGLYTNGAPPTVPAIDLTGTGIDLHTAYIFAAQLTYDGTGTLTMTLTNTVSSATWSHTFAIDIPETIGSTTAYAGFTGSTGVNTAIQQILSWTFTNP